MKYLIHRRHAFLFIRTWNQNPNSKFLLATKFTWLESTDPQLSNAPRFTFIISMPVDLRFDESHQRHITFFLETSNSEISTYFFSEASEGLETSFEVNAFSCGSICCERTHSRLLNQYYAHMWHKIYACGFEIKISTRNFCWQQNVHGWKVLTLSFPTHQDLLS